LAEPVLQLQPEQSLAGPVPRLQPERSLVEPALPRARRLREASRPLISQTEQDKASLTFLLLETDDEPTNFLL
jgi:hypothetical protein